MFSIIFLYSGIFFQYIVQRCDSVLSKFPEMLENFMKNCTFLLYSVQFPENDKLLAKFSEIMKFLEKSHPDSADLSRGSDKKNI